jgi:O-antigen biosynthesis protein
MKVEFYHIDAFEVPNYEPIWQNLRAMGVDARLVGVPDPYNAAASGWFDFERFKTYCHEHSLAFTTEADSTADIAVTTQNIDILKNYSCPRVRIMYGPIAYPAAWGLQPHATKPFDAVLTHGKFYADLYSSLLRPEQLPIVGYPRYDNFFAGKLSRDVIRARWGVNDNKPVLVFLPTWGDNTAFEKFFLPLLHLSHRYQIVLRPHHCTLRFEPQRMAMLKASGLLILENAFDLAEVYAGADVILSDARSGGLFEACLCNVPTVGMVIDPAEITGWIAHASVDQMISVCSDPAQLEAAIESALTSKTQAEQREKWIEPRVAYRDGSAGRAAANALIKLAETSAAKVVHKVVKKKILFLLGSANMSGGTYVVFQHAQYLQSIGYDVTIALVFMSSNDFMALKNSDQCWHEAIKTLSFVQIDEAMHQHYDVSIFTWWATLFQIHKIKASHHVYFVQSIESRFYDAQETFMRDLVLRTYKLGLPVITEATWIQHYLTSRFNNTCALVKNGVLKSVYKADGDAYAEKPVQGIRMLVEGPLDAIFKNVDKTIELCTRANCGEIWLLTSSPCKYYPGVARVFSQVPIYDVPKIYRSCDVIVKLSYVEGMFGPPLEMFHCGGTAIVYDVTGHDEYIVHNENALVVKTDDENAVIRSLQQLSQDKNFLQRLKQGAMLTAKAWMDWDQSSSEFADALVSYMTQPQPSDIQEKALYYLREHINIEQWIGDQCERGQLTAQPLYESGFYALTIPVAPDMSKIAIQLGKHYHVVALTLLKLLKINKMNFEITEESNIQAVSYSADQIDKLNDQGLFRCRSEAGALTAMFLHQHMFNHAEFQYCIQLEFKPIQIVDVTTLPLTV